MSKEVIVFTSPTCGPCKIMKPELEFQQSVHGFPMRFVVMGPDKAAEFAKFGVRSVPAVVCMDGDKEVGRFIGSQTTAGIEGFFREWGLL